MVSKKRLEFGFNGYRSPIVPRAPRSIRKRGPHKKSVEDSKLCAFELLATVAGQLLQESESSASSNVAERKIHIGICQHGNEKGQPKDVKALKSESYDRGSFAESAFFPEIPVQECSLLSNFKGISQAENGSVLEHSSVHESSDSLEKVDCDRKLMICEEKNADGFTMNKVGELNNKVEIGAETQSEDDKNKIGDLSMTNKSTVKDPTGERVNTKVLINSDSSVQLPLYRDPIPDALLQKHWNNVKLGIRDDDENSFGCNKFCTKIRSFRPQPFTGHRRTRKMLTSKYWRVAPKVKDYELFNTRERMKTFYRYRKSVYARERCQREPIKKRKLSDHSFAVAYGQDASSDSISNLPQKGAWGDKNSSSVILHRANGAPTTVTGHQKAKDPHVKFSIKSFRVPELYIEVPETATVGSLKRSVMEAVTTILGGGLRVGIVLQGKKVGDNNRTLLQAGISQSSNLDNLGFTLEPNFTRVSPPTTPEKLPLALPCDPDQQLPRSPAPPMIDSRILHASVDQPVINMLDDDDVKNEIISSPHTPTDVLMDEAVSDSKALVPVPPMNVEELAVVPLNPKHKRSELSQRRTRRPFSVGEVEALVEAVEKLGTGRWRDVKMRAFENADHRTYVDLKDKWKTLVHTGSIAPQQRRGEPVPQDLLDRVLAAHSYWSQHQSKQHGKHPVGPLKIVDAGKETVVT